jgi:uncharacterized protein (TIGR03118 family)
MVTEAVQPQPQTHGRGRPVPRRRFRTRRWVVTAGVAAGVVVGAAVSPAGAEGTEQDHHGQGLSENAFVQTNLVSNRNDQGAQITDANLKNPWGVSMGPTTPLWVSDNNAAVSTLYSINSGGTMVMKVPRTVNIPGGRTATGDGPSPTGQVFNPTTGFVVTGPSGTGPALFIFDSESGQITAWSPAADPFSPDMATAELAPVNSDLSATAVYKGLAIATDSDGTFLYATNFHDGTIDVINSQWKVQTPIPGRFTDPSLPAGYAPFGIQVLNDLLYVSYAKQNAAGHDDVAGQGHGFIDIYTLNGVLVERLASRVALDSPWGMEIAPPSFGAFAGKLLVGNFGDGRISVFDPFRPQHFLGQLRDEQHRAITIDGLWALRVGTDTTGGTGTVLFTAGINDEQDGLLGSINPAG